MNNSRKALISCVQHCQFSWKSNCLSSLYTLHPFRQDSLPTFIYKLVTVYAGKTFSIVLLIPLSFGPMLFQCWGPCWQTTKCQLWLNIWHFSRIPSYPFYRVPETLRSKRGFSPVTPDIIVLWNLHLDHIRISLIYPMARTKESGADIVKN